MNTYHFFLNETNVVRYSVQAPNKDVAYQLAQDHLDEGEVDFSRGERLDSEVIFDSEEPNNVL